MRKSLQFSTLALWKVLWRSVGLGESKMVGNKMSFVQLGHGPLDYQVCTYPGSRATFRGPAQDLSGAFVLCLGGSETFGKFVAQPFSELLQAALGGVVVNMGAMNASVDFMLFDPAVTAAREAAKQIVLQVPPAHNLSNRFYTVHPRRNDRLIKASALLQTIYREVDFTDFHYTRHMLSALQVLSADRFDIIVHELRTAWAARMRQLITSFSVPVHLLWMSQRAPDDYAPDAVLGIDPLFVTTEMMAEIASLASSVTLSAWPQVEHDVGLSGMFFGPREAKAACLMPVPDHHLHTANALVSKLRPNTTKRKRPANQR
ncbi:MAG: hypothetical protein ACI81Q_001273 [Paracoccaceae bacterium]|jgi:hypothetical protein